VCCSVLQCVAVCCSARQCVAVNDSCPTYKSRHYIVVAESLVYYCVEVCCSVLQCVALCCSVLQ